MKLKRLILQGFKSFADKTEFEFRDGITVIVGPNGCGKSNVVDAVKWVLGEQRPSSLRGKEMQDVIFSGTDSRKGLGFAEVTLVLDNAQQTLPIDYDEVAVTRRLYRSGESEYLLNANRVRLRDIRELMMDSGGGPGALTVMEQGNIDRLLRADPAERRQVFEEAAGISKYRARRRETERKLQRTADNLARLLDILSEYETRQRSLKIQAGKARRWKEFTEELKKKQLTGAFARYHELDRRRAASQQELDDIAGLEQDARTSLESALGATEEQRADLDALRDKVAQGEARLATLIGERRAAEERQAALVREAAELLERADGADEASADAGQRAVSFRAQLDGARRERTLAAAELEARNATLLEVTALYDEVEGRVGLLRDQRDALDMSRVEAFAAETAARNEEMGADAEVRALRSRLERLEKRRANSGEELRELTAARAESDLLLRKTEDEQRALEERWNAAEIGARDARTAADEATERAGRLTGAEAALSARRDVLSGLLADGEGLSAGTRALLETDEVNGVRGMLADLIEDAGAEAAALDQALGDLAGAVVVETTRDAVAALEWLKEGRRGRARLIPLDRVGAAPLPSRFADVRSSVAPLVGALLRETHVVATLEDALAVAGGRVVVLTGEEIESSGVLVGGTGDAGAGLVLRKSQLAEVEERLARTEAEREASEAEVRDARQRAAQWEATLEELRPRLRDARERLRSAGEAFASAERAAAARTSEIDLENAEAADVDALIKENVARRDAARSKREAAEAARKKLDEESQDLVGRLMKAGGAREEAASRVTDVRVELARWTEKADASGQRLAALEESIAAAEREAEARTREAAACRERRTACLAEIETLERLAVERETTTNELTREVEAERKRVRTMQEDLESGGARVRALREAHEKRREELERHRMRENELRLRIENLLEQVRRDYGLELEGMEVDEEAADADPEQLEAEIVELRTKLERLGNVNHTALEQLTEVEEKLTFMKREESDLRDADKQLRETIEKIDTVCTDLFTTTFASVAEHFQVIFRKLFGGGKAEIFLEDAEDVLNSGIEIRVRPPGKELRNMALLSGGERSLTTVALLFSIYQTKPPPFCLLDEVDAALDESNTVRMCELLKEFARDGQFIIITHARPTMTVADRLYGVTMPDAGVSRRVAVQFQDIEAGRVVGLN